MTATILSPAILEALREARGYLVTRVRLRMGTTVGSYDVDVEGPGLPSVSSLIESGDAEGIVAISGIAHAEDWSWQFAFRIELDGIRVASNAPEDEGSAITKALHSLMGSPA